LYLSSKNRAFDELSPSANEAEGRFLCSLCFQAFCGLAEPFLRFFKYLPAKGALPRRADVRAECASLALPTIMVETPFAAKA
jgi:hypothetical protein